MKEFHNAYFTENQETGLTISNFSDFCLDTGLYSFNHDRNLPNPHIIGLSDTEFNQQRDAYGQPDGVGALGKLEFGPGWESFDGKVIYNRDFFSNQIAANGESFEDILPIAVEYELRRLFTQLESYWHNPYAVGAELEDQDYYDAIYRSEEHAAGAGQLPKFTEYLRIKTLAERPEELNWQHDTQDRMLFMHYIDLAGIELASTHNWTGK